MDAPSPNQTLIQHGDFVRALARALVRDEHAAEDVVQDTWLRFLRHRPDAERGLRPWLRRVTANLAANRARSEAERAARQKLAARSEAQEPDVDRPAEAELLRGLVEEVLALDEPYRETILARYFRARSAAEIAEATTTPLATVRSREQRGLARLRERLDVRLGRERALWSLALVRVLELEPVPQPIGAARVAPAAKIGLALGGVAAVAAVALVWRASLPVAASPENSGATTLVSAPPAEVERARTEPAAREPVGHAAVVPAAHPARGRLRRTGALSSAGGSTAIQAATSEVRGRFLLPGGAPAADQSLTLVADYTMESAAAWPDVNASCDSEGRFSISFAPGSGHEFRLEAKRAGFARENWSLNGLENGGELDLGDVELRPGGAVEGRLLDASGNPILSAGWRVQAGSGSGWGYGPSASAHGGATLEPVRETADVDPSSGLFHFDDLAPELLPLSAFTALASVNGGTVQVIANTLASADIVYAGPDLAQRIAVAVDVNPISLLPAFLAAATSGGTFDPTTVHLSAAGFAPRTPHTIPDLDVLVFDDVPSGAYELTIDDPRLEPWSRSGITPASRVVAELRGNSAVQLDVRDAQGAALTTYTSEFEWVPHSQAGSTTSVRKATFSSALGGTCAGLVAGDYRLRVSVDGRGMRELDVTDLQAGEQRAVLVTFGPAQVISGHVTHADGSPAADVVVMLLNPALVDDSPASPVLKLNWVSTNDEKHRKEVAHVQTDASGSYAFELTRPDAYVVHAYASADVLQLQVTVPPPSASSPSFFVATGETLRVVDLVLP